MFCVKSLQLYFISKLKSVTVFYQSRRKKMAAVALGIDETCNSVQLNGFLVKHFIFIICFPKVQLYPCIRGGSRGRVQGMRTPPPEMKLLSSYIRIRF